MRPIRPSLVAVMFALLVTAGVASSAAASHPSRPLWTVELNSAAGPSCMDIDKDDDQRGTFVIDNLCDQKMIIDSATCSPDICKLETIEIPTDTSQSLAPDSFGLTADDVEKGNTVHVEFSPKLDENTQPTIAVAFTFDGWSDASHSAGDAGADTGSDVGRAGDAGADTSGGDQSDVALSSDAGAGDDGASGGESEGGGCSTAGGGPGAPVFTFVLIASIFGLRTRHRR